MPATPVKTGSVPFPWPLGKILPGATFASACVPITQNIQPVNNDLTVDNQFNGIFIQANPANTGLMYVCTNASAPDLVNYTNVVGILGIGGQWVRGKEYANNRDISVIFVGATNATDFAIAVLDQF